MHYDISKLADELISKTDETPEEKTASKEVRTFESALASDLKKVAKVLKENSKKTSQLTYEDIMNYVGLFK